jgi:glycosyltransferase involved in cell wall biosynthesis
LLEADVAHLHSNGMLVEVAAMTARRVGCPYVITLYGTDVWDHDPRRHRRFRQAVQHASTRIFYSRALREFAEPLGLAPAPAIVLYAPVDDAFVPVNAVQRREIRHSLGLDDRPVVLTVKRLHRVAGYDVAIAAFAEIARARPDVLWVIAGYGDLRPQLEAEVRVRGLTDQVRFLGLTPQDQLPRWYAAADLFLLASRLESWGAVTLEALACGTPVVATATGGTREIRDLFPDDVTIVPVDDAAALASAASAVLATPRRASEVAARRIDDAFRLPGAARAYLALYEGAAGGRGRATATAR